MELLHLVDEEYLGFFHSSKNMATTQSNGIRMRHYFMGAYTFSKNPPFEITHISAKPIIGKNFYTETSNDPWTPLKVVFPVGYVYDEKFIWVSYGKQDHEIWIVKMNKEGLLKSLL